MSFKRVQIQLAGPICGCEHQNLAWFICGTLPDRPSLGLRCETCQVVVTIPTTEFKAGFVLDRAYPKGLKGAPTPPPKEEERRLKVLDGGLARVIPFGVPRQEDVDAK